MFKVTVEREVSRTLLLLNLAKKFTTQDYYFYFCVTCIELTSKEKKMQFSYLITCFADKSAQEHQQLNTFAPR